MTRTSDQNVVQVHKHTVQTTTNGVHEPLERLRRIFQAKGHVQEFKQSKRSYDGRLADILSTNRYLIVTTDQINF